MSKSNETNTKDSIRQKSVGGGQKSSIVTEPYWEGLYTVQVWDSVWSDTDLQGDHLRMLKNCTGTFSPNVLIFLDPLPPGLTLEIFLKPFLHLFNESFSDSPKLII